MIQIVNYLGQEIKFEVTNPEDHLQKYWLAGHFYEEGMLQFIQKFRKYKLQPVIVDVGACIGNHTIFFAKVMGAYVYAFEPDNDNYDLLLKNALLNRVESSVLLIKRGAGAHMGIARFKKDITGNCGMGKISPDGCDTIRVTYIDCIISNSHRVDVLKIDVEGYNIPVLEGARYTINHDHPEIYIECQTPEELKEVEDFLNPIGYTRWPHPFNATPTWLFYH